MFKIQVILIVVLLLSSFLSQNMLLAQNSCHTAITVAATETKMTNTDYLSRIQVNIEAINIKNQSNTTRRNNTNLIRAINRDIKSLGRLSPRQEEELFRLRGLLIITLSRNIFYIQRDIRSDEAINAEDLNKKILFYKSHRLADKYHVVNLFNSFDIKLGVNLNTNVDSGIAYKTLLLASVYRFNESVNDFPALKNTLLVSFDNFNFSSFRRFNLHFTFFALLRSGQFIVPSSYHAQAFDALKSNIDQVPIKTIAQHYRNLLSTGAAPDYEIENFIYENLQGSINRSITTPLSEFKSAQRAIVDFIAEGLMNTSAINSNDAIEDSLRSLYTTIELLNLRDNSSAHQGLFYLYVRAKLHLPSADIELITDTDLQQQRAGKPWPGLVDAIKNESPGSNPMPDYVLGKYLPPVSAYMGSEQLIIEVNDPKNTVLVLALNSSGYPELNLRPESNLNLITDAIYDGMNLKVIRISSKDL